MAFSIISYASKTTFVKKDGLFLTNYFILENHIEYNSKKLHVYLNLFENVL